MLKYRPHLASPWTILSRMYTIHTRNNVRYMLYLLCLYIRNTILNIDAFLKRQNEILGIVMEIMWHWSKCCQSTNFQLPWSMNKGTQPINKWYYSIVNQRWKRQVPQGADQASISIHTSDTNTIVGNCIHIQGITVCSPRAYST